ncbi:xyloside xylosyltransferase 1-like [Lineus longissimus]|uniref:xyloside xylosyltransferase 1-like n=1 Tax=Lineus longissimus TaxID=88925 RepID=UPI002B4D8005
MFITCLQVTFLIGQYRKHPIIHCKPNWQSRPQNKMKRVLYIDPVERIGAKTGSENVFPSKMVDHVDWRLIFVQWVRTNCFKVIILSLFVVGLYFYYWSRPQNNFWTNFSEESSKIYNKGVDKEERKELKLQNFAHTKISSEHFQETPFVSEKQFGNDVKSQGIDVLLLFSKAKNNWPLRNKFSVMVQSLLETSSIPLRLHVIGDSESQEIATQTLEGIKKSDAETSNYTLMSHEIDTMAKQLHEIVKPLQDHFSAHPGAYYSDALFFLSVAVHRVMPDTMHRAIMLDADLKFYTDIAELYNLFGKFSPNQVIGIANEMQPVYRHTFYPYRSKNQGTRVGDPPPDGKPGFNSGVLLLDLDKMRKSELYNAQINRDKIKTLTDKYSFKGHLGDQDFFTLLGMEFDDLFYVIPCCWNRQLCQWWKDKGYESIFDLYHSCKEKVNVYHGNCNTPIPDFAG